MSFLSNPCTISKGCSIWSLFVLQSRRLRLIRWFSQKQPEWCRQRSSWSLYLFPPESRLAFRSPLCLSSVNAAPHLPVLGLTNCQIGGDFLQALVHSWVQIMLSASCKLHGMGLYFPSHVDVAFPWTPPPHPTPPRRLVSSCLLLFEVLVSSHHS